MLARLVLRAALAALVHHHLTYPLTAWLLARISPRPVAADPQGTPRVTVVVAAHDEQAAIGDRVRNILGLDWPTDRLQLIVASDGSQDDTVSAARAAAGDDDRVRVLDLPRAGKVAAQNAAVEQAAGTVLAFGDANARWEPDALGHLTGALADPAVGYVCGRLAYRDPEGNNQEGLYWRLELWLRGQESAAGSVTAGNGAIYATRADTYQHLDPRMGHDLALPTATVRAGFRAVYAPLARASETMVPDTAGEARRKRRMMARTWLIVVRGRLWDPRGLGSRHVFAVFSHRLLRYASPFAHLAVLLAAGHLLAHRPGSRTLAGVTVAGHATLAAAALAGRPGAPLPLALARYYVGVTAAPALGLWDVARHPIPATWDSPEGTR
ncbi:MAG: glycosyltransferase [Solirubrobacterales bacterium]